MLAHELLKRIVSENSDPLFTQLYGNEGLGAAKARYLALAEATIRDFPETAENLRVFTAPGRTELGGNHTDHNHGKVLAASIQLDAVAFVAPRDDFTVIFRSTGYPDVVVDLSDLRPRNKEIGTTDALVRGIAAEFSSRGVGVRGFTANAASTVLPGSGLSSSAAIEVLLGTIFDCLFGRGKRSAVELAQIGQRAENIYFGKPCGLMDQVACASGGAVAIDFADPAVPMVRKVDFDPASSGYALCVVDTGGNHADLTPDYAAIPAEMKAVAAFFGKTVLRELNRRDLTTGAPEIRRALGDRAFLRALHFMAENHRVDAMIVALERAKTAHNDTQRSEAVEIFLREVETSGNSSWELLQNVFSPRDPREQGVSVALAMTREFLDSVSREDCSGIFPGTCRVHGGGFAGTIQTYIPLIRVPDYIEWMKGIFGPKAVTVLRIRPVGAGELQF